MAGKPGRAAQIWALQIAEGIQRKVAEGKQLPFELPELEIVPKGAGIRIIQEVGLAKKQLDGREIAKREERAVLQQQKAQIAGARIPEDYTPEIYAWKLAMRELEPGETPRVEFFVTLPTGRKRASGKMDTMALAFLDKVGGFAPARLNSSAGEFYGVPETRDIPKLPVLPKTLDDEPDAQEAILAKYMQGEE